MAAILAICKLDPRATFLKMAAPKFRKELVLVMLAVISEFSFRGGGVHGDLFSPPRLV